MSDGTCTRKRPSRAGRRHGSHARGFKRRWPRFLSRRHLIGDQYKYVSGTTDHQLLLHAADALVGVAPIAPLPCIHQRKRSKPWLVCAVRVGGERRRRRGAHRCDGRHHHRPVQQVDRVPGRTPITSRAYLCFFFCFLPPPPATAAVLPHATQQSQSRQVSQW